VNFFKRGITSITKNLGKTAILLILVFVLGSLIAGAISVQRAVVNTETNLRRNMRPIVNLEYDVFAFITQAEDSWNEDPEHISVDTIRYLGDLPYVQYYNYSIQTSLHSFTFQNYVPAMVGHEVVDWRVASGMEEWPLDFEMTGVSRAEVLYIEQGSAEIVEGRTFTEAEMMTSTDFETIPIVMSRSHAHANDLFLGATFYLSNMISYVDANGRAISWEEDELFANHEYVFEIVGLFDLPDRRTDLIASDDDDQEEHARQHMELNRMYIPGWAAEEIERRSILTTSEMKTELGIELLGWENFDPTNFQVRAEPLFILEDPLDIETFSAIARPLIPSYYHVRDLSGNFEEISTSMETMLWIADIILIVTIVATVLVLTLIIILFLRDRRYEMGVYLALGEKKGKIAFQVIFEIVTTAFIGITLALFVGHIVSNQVSQTLLRSELMQEPEPEPSTGMYGIWTYFERLKLTTEMPVDEMMDAFDVSLDTQTVITFYGIGMITIVVSTLLPVAYVVRLNPKKVLLEAKS